MSADDHQDREAVAGEAGYALALPITFAHGAGVTLAVSREEVRFTTDAAVAVGQRLSGHVRFPPAEEGAVATLLRYDARVTDVGRPYGSDGPLEVRARFEALTFVPAGPCAVPGEPATPRCAQVSSRRA